jgi:hypothetical protein
MNQKNKAASIRARLKNKAKEEGRPFQEILQYYAMERFLYRFSISPYVDKFILKGALMLRVWDNPETRPTMDIDFLGRTSNELEKIKAQITEIVNTESYDNGLSFDSSNLEVLRIKESADYQGVRVKFKAFLESARINMQIDIGFGDVVVPLPQKSEFPVILNDPAPYILCYSRESTIAEKFEAMVKLGELNSRMKDFYDIWLLARQFSFESRTLQTAIKRTFENRGTQIPQNIKAFSIEFTSTKQNQWKSFRKRLKIFRNKVLIQSLSK